MIWKVLISTICNAGLHTLVVEFGSEEAGLTAVQILNRHQKEHPGPPYYEAIPLWEKEEKL